MIDEKENQPIPEIPELPVSDDEADEDTAAEGAPAADDVAPPTGPSLEERLQAEYLRGRNDAIAEYIDRPQVWQMAESAAPRDRRKVEILSRMRRSVWD